MRKVFLAIAITIFLFSCKKEKSFNPAGGTTGGGTTATVLTKAVTKFGPNDSIIVFYGYDNQKRFISYKYDLVSSGNHYGGEYTFVRNAQGVVQKVIIKSDDLATSGLDSLVSIVHYNTSSSRYTSSVITLDENGSTVKDSTAFTYNAAGKMIQSEEFLDDGISGGYGEIAKTEYTYDAEGNIIKSKNYYFDDSTGTYVASDQDVYEYDTKVNPLVLGNEAFLLGDPSLVSTHNITKDTYTDLEDATNNDVTTNVYTYNASNKPITGTVTVLSEGVPYPATYTYK